MSDNLIVIDGGYSSLKGYHKGEFHKIPTSVSFAPLTTIGVGDSKVYDFEGEKFTVGRVSADEGSFTTTNFSFKEKYDPLIIKHFRDHLKIDDTEVPDIRMSLALIDWNHKDDLIKRCSEYTVDGKVIRNKISVVPQGMGAYYDFVTNINNSEHPLTAYVLEIGYNTINVMYFENGVPLRDQSKGLPNHGVSSIIRPFTNFLESKYSMRFSEQEALKIFQNNKFSFSGKLDESIPEAIATYKRQFVSKLFNSILVSDRKLITTSEKVILAGGGCYFMENTQFPANVVMNRKAYEFSNLRGMII